MTGAYIKDPDGVLDYAVDWATWLADAEEITSSTWVVPEGITKDSDSSTTSTGTVWLSGGTAGQQYRITHRITTSQGRTDDRSITIYVQDR